MTTPNITQEPEAERERLIDQSLGERCKITPLDYRQYVFLFVKSAGDPTREP